ncbi:aminoglycoside phosphotransferase [Bacillus manliponensis]|uniref:Aminoglycoside phosphotransferase n=1 Tax=Bacillus manliponensis TaxID=574376 RepID=A0A073JVS6_9BACI|nr:aminoglycoside phosphotransferase family protein [Bacillus manliponensis]KEK18316.1 aminoglycoside phosphotransferase [Bacillus manliponensis]
MDRTLFQKQIHILQDAKGIKELSKGLSEDKKYVVTLANDEKVLLRIGSVDVYERKKIEFQILHEMQKRHVHAPKPIEMGAIEEIESYYSIVSYVEGEDAKTALQSCTLEEQYNIGVQAGEDLARMNTYEAPKEIGSWYERAMAKHRRYLDEYKKCGVTIEQDEKIIRFIDTYEHYLKNRPNRFQHDDFHLENIIVKGNAYAGVIDFDGYDWGDPLHDFVKVALFAREISIPYCMGQIDGYFQGGIPDDFWTLYAVYAAMTVFSSVVWSLKVAPHIFDDTMERLYTVLDDHQYFELMKPKWFQRELFVEK